MRIITLDEIRAVIDDAAIIDLMREALITQARGECDTPMPMHLNCDGGGEVHIKASYRRGGKYFALKLASTFGGVGNGMMLLASAKTGEPVALLQDAGHLTDVRTAAVAAMVARELGRKDRVIGILGSGIQARLTARFHARVLPLERVWLWGRSPERVEECAAELRRTTADVRIAKAPAEVAANAKLIVTATASRAPLLFASDLQDGTHISAIGADSPGKHELDQEVLRRAELLLCDSIAQCEKLGELQHAPDQKQRAVAMGSPSVGTSACATKTVADFTGLGVEDLFIAEWIYTHAN